MPPRLLTIDVGNSRIKIGLFDFAPRSNDSLPECLRSTTLDVESDLPWSEVLGWVEPKESLYGIVAGANPQGVRKVVESWPADHWRPPIVIENPIDLPLDVKLAAPEKAGIDRLLNAVAANVVRPREEAVVIVDTGTATTVDYVDIDGAFTGGAILPGFELSARALHHYTALLPYISIEELANLPHAPLGTDTREALCSGLYWGQLGAVRELISQYSRVSTAATNVLLTGGGAGLIAEQLAHSQWVPRLALQGLAIVAMTHLDDRDDDSD